MRVDTEDLARGLFAELGAVLSKYNDSLLTPTVIGVLEIIKAELMYQNSAFDPNHPNNQETDCD